MESSGMKTLGVGIDVAINHVGGEDMAGVRVGIAEEVGERDSRKRVVVGEFVLEEFHDGGFIEMKARGEGIRGRIG
jgi:hypothetical protein